MSAHRIRRPAYATSAARQGNEVLNRNAAVSLSCGWRSSDGPKPTESCLARFTEANRRAELVLQPGYARRGNRHGASVRTKVATPRVVRVRPWLGPSQHTNVPPRAAGTRVNHLKPFSSHAAAGTSRPSSIARLPQPRPSVPLAGIEFARDDQHIGCVAVTSDRTVAASGEARNHTDIGLADEWRRSRAKLGPPCRVVAQVAPR